MEDIEKKFAERGIIRGGLLLLRPEDALELIDEAARKRRKVLGVDGFIITNNSTQPLMDESINLSKYPLECWEKAKRFLLCRVDRDLFFEIILD